MLFLTIMLRILLGAIIFIVFLLGKRLYKDYKSLTDSEDYQEMTIFGRLTIGAMFTVSILGMIMLSCFSAFVILSKITLESYF